MERIISIHSRSEMINSASSIAPQLRIGDLLLLEGPLGAGKTFFAQALAKALGVQAEVTSPTFVMAKSYHGNVPINHIDAYRLLDLANPVQAFDELDIDFEKSLTIVEWGSDFDFTGEALHITIEIGEGESRRVTFSGADSRWSQLHL
jgi:tRNA threonylcarbamoyl adenosine modification protein YjeE